jgi:hypothetical protein
MTDDRVEGIYLPEFRRLVRMLREKYPRVLEANRFFEEETGWDNEPGGNNLVDVLSHIGTLFEEAPNLSEDRQRDQVTLIEDHLRRSMMESWEQLLDFRLGEVDKLWDEYLQEARPLQETGELRGSPTAQQLDRMRRRYKSCLDRGRAAKRKADWDGWERGTEAFIEACKIATELYEGVEQSIAAARQHRADIQASRQRRRLLSRQRAEGEVARREFKVSTLLAIGFFVATLFLGGLIDRVIF